MIEHIAFSPDDTLWHSETHIREAQAQFRQLMQLYLDGAYDDRYLLETERRNVQYYGHGVKGLGLSMIETALELTGGRIAPEHIRLLLNITKELLAAPVEVLPEVEAVLDELSGDYPLMAIAKGDLLDLETKLVRSGLSEYFRCLEVVSEKDRFSYSRVLRRHRIRPENFLMVGSSLPLDVWPVLEIGGQAVYIPPPTAQGEGPRPQGAYVQLERIGQLPDWLEARLLVA